MYREDKQHGVFRYLLTIKEYIKVYVEIYVQKKKGTTVAYHSCLASC